MTVYRRLFTLHILRHGETGFNQLGIVQGAGVDAPLSNIGFIQAMGVGGVLKSLPGVLSSPWTVYCSTMKRTRESLSGFLLGFDMEVRDGMLQTGRFLTNSLLALPPYPPLRPSKDFDLGPEAALPSRNHPTSTAFTPTPPSFTDALREKAQGCREGKRNDMSQEEAERLDEAAGIDVASKFKESDKDVEVRVLDLLGGIIEDTAATSPPPSHTNVLMVTHGGVIRVLLRDVFKVGGGPGQERIRGEGWSEATAKALQGFPT
jgi:broad specificity phosphatase PhoE